MRHGWWLFAYPALVNAGPGGLFKKKFASAPIQFPPPLPPPSKGPPHPIQIGKVPMLPPPPPPQKALLPPPIERGPDFIALQPVVDHQIVVFESPQAAILEEPVMLAPPPPPPQMHLQMPPQQSAYVPPTFVDLPPPQKYPTIIHGTPVNVPAVPDFLPTKEGRVGPGFYPVAVLGNPSQGQFVRVGRAPAKEGPTLPNPPVHIRPTMKGEM